MGRKRTGYIRERGDRFEVWIGEEYIGIYDDHVKADRMRRAALADDDGTAPEAFGLFAADWMDKRELAAQRRKRSRSFDKELSRWNTHVRPAKFWDLPWKRITPKVVQEWVSLLCEKEALDTIRTKAGTQYRKTGRLLSRRVVEDSLSLVKNCLDAAVVAGKFSWCNNQNPARLVKLPRSEPPELDGELIVHASTEEIARLFALKLPPLQRAVFAVAIYAGLRLDEIWGLRWQDALLTAKRPELRVRRSYDGPVKSKTSLRDVPLLPPALAALKAWKAEHPTPPIAGLVFPREDGKCHDESYVAGWRDKLDKSRSDEPAPGWATKARIRPEVTFQCLRHTCGCHLAQGTWTPRPLTLHEIKRWMGHSSISVTERHYAALTSDNLHNAVADSGFTGYKPGALDDHTR